MRIIITQMSLCLTVAGEGKPVAVAVLRTRGLEFSLRSEVPSVANRGQITVFMKFEAFLQGLAEEYSFVFSVDDDSEELGFLVCVLAYCGVTIHSPANAVFSLLLSSDLRSSDSRTLFHHVAYFHFRSNFK
jgi:hypothetical protein